MQDLAAVAATVEPVGPTMPDRVRAVAPVMATPSTETRAQIIEFLATNVAAEQILHARQHERQPSRGSTTGEHVVDLTICPGEIRALDHHADEAWSLFLKKTGISMSVDGKRVLDNESRRAQIIRNFGVPSLVQRLGAARTEVERAQVWWRESVACSEGDGIPDLSGDNLYVLNAFIFDPALKFADRRVEAMRAGRPRKSDEEKQEASALPRRHSRRQVNVTQQADAAFMDELKNTDRARYDRLTASIQQGEGGDMPPVCWVEPADSRCLCGASLVGKRRGAKWCSDVCRMRLGRQNNPKTCIQNKGVADAKNCFPVDRPTLSENGLSRTKRTAPIVVPEPPASLGQTDAQAA